MTNKEAEEAGIRPMLVADLVQALRHRPAFEVSIEDISYGSFLRPRPDFSMVSEPGITITCIADGKRCAVQLSLYAAYVLEEQP